MLATLTNTTIEWALTSQRRSRLGDPGRQQESVAGIDRAGDLSRGQQAHERRTMRMAKQVEQQNGIEMQCAGSVKHAEEQKKKNREIILKLMRSIYFLA